MSKTTHPALEALRKIRDVHTQVFRYGLNRNSAVASMNEHAQEAIPALEALLAERDELLAALEGLTSEFDIARFRESPSGRVLAIARAALAKGES